MLDTSISVKKKKIETLCAKHDDIRDHMCVSVITIYLWSSRRRDYDLQSLSTAPITAFLHLLRAHFSHFTTLQSRALPNGISRAAACIFIDVPLAHVAMTLVSIFL
jgi:hypothetical protein